MRRRKIRRELAALGHERHHPTPTTRAKVRILAFNKNTHETIAAYLSIDVTVLRYWYADELNLSEMEVLAIAAENVIALANQKNDLGVALRANEMMLRARSAAWREPKAADPPAPPVEDIPVQSLTLDQVEKELARLEHGGTKQ